MKKLILLILFFCAIVSTHANLIEKFSKDCFAVTVSKHFIPKKDGNKIPALQYRPSDFDHEKKYPIVIFLHGRDEKGDGTESGLLNLSNSNNHYNLLLAAEQRGFIVLAPQFVQAYNNWRPDWNGGTYLNEVIDWIIQNLPIDNSRIYLTGLSSGGGGVWDYLIRDISFTKKIAAAVPICPAPQDGNWSLISEAKIPVWAFHANNDPSNPVTATLNPVNLLNSTYKIVPEAKKTVYANGVFPNNQAHFIWSKVYDPQNSLLYDWLLSQKRYDTIPPPVIKTIVARLFVSGMEVIIYSDKTAEVR